MKKLLLVLPLLAALIYYTGCKKCWNCQNSCEKCLLSDSGVVITQLICNDDSDIGSEVQFEQAIQKSVSLGYNCVSISPTYSQSYCVNPPGDSSSLVYFDKGGRVKCTPK